jgi:hypothetical protein
MDISKMRGRSIWDRQSKVRLEAFAHPYIKGTGVTGLLETLPGILAGHDFRALADRIHKARCGKRAIIWGMGGHVIKYGLAPILIDLMDRQFITANLDCIQHYRPTQNVIQRPTAKSGQGIALTSHHEILLPLLAAALIENTPDEI